MLKIDENVDYEPYRFGDPAMRLAGDASEAGRDSEPFSETLFPFVAASIEVECCVAGRGREVEGADKVLIEVCRSARSCCRARLNLSSLSSLVSSCRFSFSINLNLTERTRRGCQRRNKDARPYLFTRFPLVLFGDLPTMTKIISFFLQFLDSLSHLLYFRVTRRDHLTTLLNGRLKFLISLRVRGHLRTKAQFGCR